MARRALVGLLLAAVVSTSGCSVFGGDDPAGTPVADVKPGMCFPTPAQASAQVTTLDAVSCSTPHTREAYAAVDYTPPAGADAGAYPGADALTTFAQGRCAAAFGRYVGVDYLDSTLFFTFLTPSPTSWENDDDRTVLCFVLSTGQPLTDTVKGSKL